MILPKLSPLLVYYCWCGTLEQGPMANVFRT
jgi:hypothetical protein